MQRRIRPNTLSDRYGTAYPAPTSRTLNIPTLNGGLNLWDLDYRMQPDQSPDLLNVYWKDGVLGSRRGQEYVFNQSTYATKYGAFYNCYEREWPTGFAIVHAGTNLYKINLSTGAHTTLISSLAAERGSFFVYGDKLYYLNSAKYIAVNSDGTASTVTPYVPTVVLNRQPSGVGGDTYQPENRISAGKRVMFTADGTSKDYYLPYKGLDSTKLTAVVNGANMTEGSGFTVNRTTGVVTFTTAPAQSTPVVANNVSITCYKSDADTMNSVMKCKYATVFGTDNLRVVVCGGTPAQPNAYFWSGNHDYMDPTYFPTEHYNLAGANATEYITGFGKQQSMLIIFKEHSIGKSSITTREINGRDSISLTYTPVNEENGCNVPGSIKLIKNNLVFANTYGGVYFLADTTLSGENNIRRISRNVNGSGRGRGLIYDLNAVSADTVSCFDDEQRYWIVVNGKAYLWDYVIAGFGSKEENLTWFLFDNINARKWVKTDTGEFYLTADGSISKFIDQYVDYGYPMVRRYAFSAQIFGTYEVLKDIQKVIFSVRSDTDSLFKITYKTDYEERDDQTPIVGYTHRLVPRNLAHRSLHPVKFAATAVRRPRCFHIRHFQMIISNNEPYTDMSVVSAQIIYCYSRKDR